MSFAELLTDLTCGTNVIIRSVASKYNLTSSQAFHLLSIPFDGISMSGLAHKLGLDTSTLTRNIQKLEKLDLVVRRSVKTDKRVHVVILKNKGSVLVESLEELLEEKTQQILEQIDLEDQENLIPILEKLSWSLESVRIKP